MIDMYRIYFILYYIICNYFYCWLVLMGLIKKRACHLHLFSSRNGNFTTLLPKNFCTHIHIPNRVIASLFICMLACLFICFVCSFSLIQTNTHSKKSDFIAIYTYSFPFRGYQNVNGKFRLVFFCILFFEIELFRKHKKWCFNACVAHTNPTGILFDFFVFGYVYSKAHFMTKVWQFDCKIYCNKRIAKLIWTFERHIGKYLQFQMLICSCCSCCFTFSECCSTLWLLKFEY